MHLFPEYKDVFSNLGSDALLISPNQRLSRFIIKQHALWMNHSEDSTWQPFRCLSWNSWLENIWDDAQILGLNDLAACHLMNTNQERVLWEEIVGECTNQEFLSCKSLADSSKQAWAYLRKWRQCLNNVLSDSEEFKLFKQCVNRYQQITEEQHLLDYTSMQEQLTELIGSVNDVKLPKQLVFVGFDDLSPLDKSFVDILKCPERDIQFLDITVQSNCNRVELPDTSAEVIAIVQWAASLVEREPRASIALVVPNLTELRPTIERVCSQVFEPQYKFSDIKRHAPSVNISAGQPLAQVPLIASAIISLKLNAHDIDIDELYTIFTSSFIGTSSELTKQIKIVTKLRSEYTRVPFSILRTAIAEAEITNLSKMINVFKEIRQKYCSRKYKPSFWVEVFCDQLASLGWPGERTLDTLEYQQLSHWPSLLQELAQLDLVLTQIDLNTALTELNKIAYVPFHAKTLESPIQILGLLEAAGQQFDYLWVMGMDYRTWPEPCKPNPLLPVSFQRELEMPRSSSDKELKLAEKLTSRLASSAKNVIFSSPMIDGDQPLRPSPLIERYSLIQMDAVEQYQASCATEVIKNARTELVNEQLTMTVESSIPVKGGVQVLKDQAACPFRAFAKHRLRAENNDALENGVTPLMRGNLLHASLEKIWAQLKSSSQLSETSIDDLNLLVEQALFNSWQEIHGTNRLGITLRDIELRRGLRLILEWLEIEKNRRPYLVFEYEKSIEMDVSGLQLTVRFDRVDRLEGSEELVVIDYKTGVVDVKSWAGERPDDPQVPLYCVALKDKQVVAAVYAQVNGKEVAAKGISLSPDVIPGVRTADAFARNNLPSNWSDLQGFWASNLENLAREFMGGEVRVKPKSIGATCLHCGLKSLCRVGVIDS